jgi:hypothetical protein
MNHAGNSSYRDDDEELFYLLNGMDGKRGNEHNNGQDHHSAPSDHHAEAASGEFVQLAALVRHRCYVVQF